MEIRRLSHLFQDLRATLKGDDIPISNLLETLHERGFGFVLIIFSAPMAIPAPKPPGLSTIFGIPLVFLTLQQVFGLHTVWFPAFVRRKTLSGAWLDNILRNALPWVRRFEILIHPRLEFMTQGFCSRLTGIAGLIMSISILLPLPGMNTIPAMGITLMSAGIMMRDGLAILFGALAGIIWVFTAGTLYILFGMEGLHALLGFFK